jgi:hypothetical protein
MTMKLKQLFVAIFATSVLFVSCSKDDVFEPVEQTSVVTPESSTVTPQGDINQRMSTSTTVSTSTPKAYIFVEPKSRLSMIVNHLKTVPHSVKTPTNTPFYGFFTGSPIRPTNFSDLRNYVDMPHWYDGRLPAVIQSNITQTPTGAYNFGTVKISGPLVNNQFVWIIVLIPVDATPNPNWRQSRMSTAHANMVYRTAFNTNSTLSNYVLNYTGTRIPAGQYRVYSTYSGTELRPKVMGDFYLKGDNR